MFDTIQRVRWKNITGLVLLVLIIFVLTAIFAFFNAWINGDCVEEDGIKVCFSPEKSQIARYEVTKITTDVINTGDSISDAVISVRISPNLENKSALAQEIGEMAPGDTIKRNFKIAAKAEAGRFRVDFDINGDGLTDKEIWLTVG